MLTGQKGTAGGGAEQHEAAQRPLLQDHAAAGPAVSPQPQERLVALADKVDTTYSQWVAACLVDHKTLFRAPRVCLSVSAHLATPPHSIQKGPSPPCRCWSYTRIIFMACGPSLQLRMTAALCPAAVTWQTKPASTMVAGCCPEPPLQHHGPCRARWSQQGLMTPPSHPDGWWHSPGVCGAA